MLGSGANYVDAATLLRRAAVKFPNKIAVVYEDGEMTYGELFDRAYRFSSTLVERGISKGDRVGILSYNSPQFLEVYLAIIQIGAVAVPLNFRLADAELVYTLDNCGAKALFTGAEFLDTANRLRGKLSALELVVSQNAGGAEGVEDHEALIASHKPFIPSMEFSPDDPCTIYYTSGTTGSPKGAVRTQYNVAWGLFGFSTGGNIGVDTVYLATPPMFHIAGLEGTVLGTLLMGGMVVSMKQFDPVAVLRNIEKHKVTNLLFVPAMSIAMLQVPDLDKYDTSSLKFWTSAAAPLSEQLKESLCKAFPKVGVRNGYGSTEAGSIAALPFEDLLRKEAACVGIPTPSVEVRVVDEKNRELPPDNEGEIVCRSPMVINEYWNAPEKTEELLRDGWMRTGDVGKFDAEGFLYIVDRKKDMIISGGENIYAAEVENVVYSLPQVFENAVIGVPDSKWGESVVAVVALKDGQSLTEEEVINHCQSLLAKYKCPKKVYFREELPHNTFGKITKNDLREKYGGSG